MAKLLVGKALTHVKSRVAFMRTKANLEYQKLLVARHHEDLQHAQANIDGDLGGGDLPALV